MGCKCVRCVVVLMIGLTIIVLACIIGHCWPEQLYYTGTVLAVALIVSAVINDSEKQRKIGSAVVFWAGFAALFIHVLVYTGQSTVTMPVHGEVVLTCFIEGIVLTLFIYYLRIQGGEESSPAHHDILPLGR